MSPENSCFPAASCLERARLQPCQKRQTKKGLQPLRFTTNDYRNSAKSTRNFCVARNSVFLIVFSVVFNIEATVRSFNP